MVTTIAEALADPRAEALRAQAEAHYLRYTRHTTAADAALARSRTAQEEREALLTARLTPIVAALDLSPEAMLAWLDTVPEDRLFQSFFASFDNPFAAFITSLVAPLTCRTWVESIRFYENEHDRLAGLDLPEPPWMAKIEQANFSAHGHYHVAEVRTLVSATESILPPALG